MPFPGLHDGGAPAPAHSVQMSKEPAAMMVYLPPGSIMNGNPGLAMNGGAMGGMPLGTMPIGGFGYPPQQPL